MSSNSWVKRRDWRAPETCFWETETYITGTEVEKLSSVPLDIASKLDYERHEKA